MIVHSFVDFAIMFRLLEGRAGASGRNSFLSLNLRLISDSYHDIWYIMRVCSIITSCLEGMWFYTFFVILREGKLGGGWYLIQVRGVKVKNVFDERFLHA